MIGLIGPGREIYFVVLVGGAPPSDCHSVTGRNAKGGPVTRGRAKKDWTQLLGWPDVDEWPSKAKHSVMGSLFFLFLYCVPCILFFRYGFSFAPLLIFLSLSARLHLQMSPKKKRSAIFCSLIEMESVGPWTSNCCLPLAPNGIRNDMDARRWMMGPRPLTVEPI